MTPYQLAEYKAHSSSLEYTALRYGLPQLDKTVTKNFINRSKGSTFTKQELSYAGADTTILAPLRDAQEYILRRDNQIEVALLEHRVVEGVIRMRVNGLGIDKKLWAKQVNEDLAATEALKKSLPKIGNWNSPHKSNSFLEIEVSIYLRSTTWSKC